MTPDAVRAAGHGKLLGTSFLALLTPDQRAAVLAIAELRAHTAGTTLIAAGTHPAGVWLLATGLVELRNAEGTRLGRFGYGHLIGDRGILEDHAGQPEVVTLCPTEALFVPRAAFLQLRESDPDLGRGLESLLRTGHEAESLIELMMGVPMLRGLGRDALLRLVHAGILEERSRGDVLMRRGTPAENVFVLLRGRVGVYRADPDRPDEDQASPLVELSAPTLVGHRAVLQGRDREHTVRSRRTSRLLRMPAQVFRSVTLANESARRAADVRPEADDAAGPTAGGADEGPRPVVITVYGDESGRGATTLAYGLGTCLASQLAQVRSPGDLRPVRILDPDLRRHAAQWGLAVTSASAPSGRTIATLKGPASWAFEVCGPDPRKTPAQLLEDATAGARCLIVSAGPQAKDQAELARRADAVVFLSTDPSREFEVAAAPNQFRVDAVRTQDDPGMSQGRVQHLVRIPPDSASAEAFLAGGDVGPITDPRTPLGAACHRLARVFRGRSVGVALGGGGAWGFAHIGLLRALAGRGIPVDFIAGTSFGAVVGGIYAAAGLPGLDRLLEWGGRVQLPALQSIVTTVGIERTVNWVCREEGPRRADLRWFTPGGLRAIRREARGPGRALVACPIPFLPVSADLLTAEPFVAHTGTIGAAVRSSVGMPGLFAPVVQGGRRLVDGGVVNNVPSSAVWRAGADFVLASNVIPRRPLAEGVPGLLRRAGRRVPFVPNRRAGDVLRSMYLLMNENGLTQAWTNSDFVLDMGDPTFPPWAFDKGETIALAGQAIAEASMDEVEAEWTTDDTVHFNRALG